MKRSALGPRILSFEVLFNVFASLSSRWRLGGHWRMDICTRSRHIGAATAAEPNDTSMGGDERLVFFLLRRRFENGAISSGAFDRVVPDWKVYATSCKMAGTAIHTLICSKKANHGLNKYRTSFSPWPTSHSSPLSVSSMSATSDWASGL